MYSTMTTSAYRVRSYDLHDLDGISDKTMQTHFKLYEGYVKETNSITEHIREFLKDGKVDQEEMRFGPLAVSPGLQRLALSAQLRDFVVAQVRVVANPDIHVAVFGLRQGAKATHQEQAMNRLACSGQWRLVGKRPGQTLSFGQRQRTGLVARHASRRAAGHIAR